MVETIKILIYKGDTREALKGLLSITKNNPTLSKEVILLSHRLETILKNNREGTISTSDYSIEINKINKSSIEILEISLADSNKLKKTDRLNKIIVITILSLLSTLLVGSYLYMQNLNTPDKPIYNIEEPTKEEILKITKEILDISNKIVQRNQTQFIEIFIDPIDIVKTKNNLTRLFQFQEYRGEMGKIKAYLNTIDSTGTSNTKTKIKTLQNTFAEFESLLYTSPHHGNNYNGKFFDKVEASLTNSNLKHHLSGINYTKYGIIMLISKTGMKSKEDTELVRILVNCYLERLREINQEFGEIYGYFLALH